MTLNFTKNAITNVTSHKSEKLPLKETGNIAPRLPRKRATSKSTIKTEILLQTADKQYLKLSRTFSQKLAQRTIANLKLNTTPQTVSQTLPNFSPKTIPQRKPQTSAEEIQNLGRGARPIYRI